MSAPVGWGLDRLPPVAWRGVRIAGALLVAIGLGTALSAVVPAIPYRILSGIAAGLLILRLRIWMGERGAAPDRTVRSAGMVLIGLNVGFSVSFDALAQAHDSMLLFLGLAFGAVIGGGVIGRVYAGFARLDLFTALIATMPGGLATMTALAIERGRDVAVVSVVQTMRLTVAILIVLTTATASATSAASGSSLPGGSSLPWAALALLSAWLALRLFERFRVPMAALFSAILAGLLVHAVGGPLLAEVAGPAVLPPLMTAAGQLLLGIGVGETIAVQPRISRQAAAYGFATVIATILVGLAAAVVARAVTGGDWLTCFLMTAPGGAPEIMTFALTLPVNIEFVTLAQVIRQLVISLLLPFWVVLFGWLARQYAGGTVSGSYETER